MAFENKANLFLDLMWKGTPEEIMPKVEYMAECVNFDLLSQISNNSSSLLSSIPISESVLMKKVNVSSLILSNNTSNKCSLDNNLESASLKNTSSLIFLIPSNDSNAKIIDPENLKITILKPANEIEKENFLNNSDINMINTFKILCVLLKITRLTYNRIRY
uniref:Uncharacterized protein n=1 Tax=Strongyloides venezuelensis TaxID=75913 RepID=A0A0K0FHZ1_STRVS